MGRWRGLVFSDADEVFHRASHDELTAAARRLHACASFDTDVVICSVRTRAQLERLHEVLGLGGPFVAESGAAVFLPSGRLTFGLPGAYTRAGYEVLGFGQAYPEVVRVLRDTASRVGVGVQGFADLPLEQVAVGLGVSLLEARLATLREYVEPFRVLDPRDGARARLVRGLEHAGLVVREAHGWNLAGGTLDPARACRALRQFYERQFGTVSAAALGGPSGSRALLASAEVTGVVAAECGPVEWADRVVRAAEALHQQRQQDARSRGGVGQYSE